MDRRNKSIKNRAYGVYTLVSGYFNRNRIIYKLMINTAVRFDDLIKNHINPFLKTNGFKKKNLNYLDFSNEVSFIINFQKSHGCSWEENMFYINYGFFIPKLRTNSEQLKAEWDCDNRSRISPNSEFQDTYGGTFLIKENTDIEKLGNFIIEGWA